LLGPPAGFSFEFDTIEVINGFELSRPEVMERNVLDWFALLNLGRRYTAVGNSDSHALVHQWAGYPRTYVRVNTLQLAQLTPEEIASSLLYGRAQISNGIFVDVTANGSAGPGDELSLESSRVSLRVLARAAPWVSLESAELWANGVKVAETTETAAPDAVNRIQWVIELEVYRDAWLVVIARGGTELGESLPGAKGMPFSIVNPIFVDADGDGAFRAALADSLTSERDAPKTATSRTRVGGGPPVPDSSQLSSGNASSGAPSLHQHEPSKSQPPP
jgi:hypothetical protein